MTPAQLTEDQKTLIRAIGFQGPATDGGVLIRYTGPTNIAAVHLDGELLMEMLWVKRELEKAKTRA
jgi:hypothetical protein